MRVLCKHTNVTESTNGRDDRRDDRATHWLCLDCGSRFPLIGDTDLWAPVWYNKPAEVVPLNPHGGGNVIDGDALERQQAEIMASKMAEQLAPFEILRGRRVMGTEVREGGQFILIFSDGIELAISGHVRFQNAGG